MKNNFLLIILLGSIIIMSLTTIIYVVLESDIARINDNKEAIKAAESE